MINNRMYPLRSTTIVLNKSYKCFEQKLVSFQPGRHFDIKHFQKFVLDEKSVTVIFLNDTIYFGFYRVVANVEMKSTTYYTVNLLLL